MVKRIAALALALVLLFSLAVKADAAETDTKPYIRQLLGYYLHYREEAETDILSVLSRMAVADWTETVTWGRIMASWHRVNTELEITLDVLPDGLPQDDSLCILVLGYSLNSNGSMKPELEARLEVALRSAQKYPNACILCTGGPTADRSNATEAQVMARWLMGKGIEKSRILIEDAAMSTTENAINSYAILNERCPQVDSVAIVTSDYHVPRGCLMFDAVSLYRAGCSGGREITVVANAACRTDTDGGESLYQQAWGLAILAGVEIDSLPVPALSRLTEITVDYNGRFSVTAQYDSGFSRDVTQKANLTGYDPENPSNQEALVTYEENGVTVSQTITIKGETPAPEPEAEPELEPVSAPPDSPVREVCTIAAVWLLAVLLLKRTGFLQ